MRPAGQRAFAARTAGRSGIYRYEHERAPQEPPLARTYVSTFKANTQAWSFFSAQPPGYRKLATRYVMSAKKEETRVRRLEQLIKDSAAGRRIGLLARPERKK